jgi:hypothetical protein
MLTRVAPVSMTAVAGCGLRCEEATVTPTAQRIDGETRNLTYMLPRWSKTKVVAGGERYRENSKDHRKGTDRCVRFQAPCTIASTGMTKNTTAPPGTHAGARGGLECQLAEDPPPAILGD